MPAYVKADKVSRADSECKGGFVLDHSVWFKKGTSRNVADKGAKADQRYRLFDVLCPVRPNPAGLIAQLQELIDNGLDTLANMVLDSLQSGLPLRFDDGVWTDVSTGKPSKAKIMDYATRTHACIKLMLDGKRDEAMAIAEAALAAASPSADNDVTHEDAAAADALFRKHWA